MKANLLNCFRLGASAKKGYDGFYLLILETADAYYTAPFLIEK